MLQGEMDFFFGGRPHLYPEYSWRLFREVLQKLKLQQGSVKYFIITGVGYSSPSTVLTLYGGTDYDLANSAIIEPYFSMAKTPYGFPLDEAKWRVEGLVTAASSVVNKETTTKIGISSGTSMRGSVGHCGYLLDLAAKATYYLNSKTGQASMTAIAFKGSKQKTKVRAMCEEIPGGPGAEKCSAAKSGAGGDL